MICRKMIVVLLLLFILIFGEDEFVLVLLMVIWFLGVIELGCRVMSMMLVLLVFFEFCLKMILMVLLEFERLGWDVEVLLFESWVFGFWVLLLGLNE